MLGRKYHEGDAEGGVRTGGEDPDLFFRHARVVKGKGYFRSLASAYPVALHDLNALRPVDAVEIHQFIGVFGDAEEPLFKVAAGNRGITSLAETAIQHLLVGEHRLALGTPVHRSFATIGQAGFVQLQEKPLRPFVVLGKAGDHFPAPVVDSAHVPELAAHVLNVLHGPGERVNTALDGGVLGRKAEGIKTHRVENVITLHPLEAGADI